MNEINQLIWPSGSKIGLVDQSAWNQTVDIAQKTKNAEGATVLTKAPEGTAYTNEYVQKALDKLAAEGVDVTGASYKPETVTLNEGGA
jgi:NitT/TauT family transport system substrate-binding protein